MTACHKVLAEFLLGHVEVFPGELKILKTIWIFLWQEILVTRVRFFSFPKNDLKHFSRRVSQLASSQTLFFGFEPSPSKATAAFQWLNWWWWWRLSKGLKYCSRGVKYCQNRRRCIFITRKGRPDRGRTTWQHASQPRQSAGQYAGNFIQLFWTSFEYLWLRTPS